MQAHDPPGRHDVATTHERFNDSREISESAVCVSEEEEEEEAKRIAASWLAQA